MDHDNALVLDFGDAPGGHYRDVDDDDEGDRPGLFSPTGQSPNAGEDSRRQHQQNRSRFGVSRQPGMQEHTEEESSNSRRRRSYYADGISSPYRDYPSPAPSQRHQQSVVSMYDGSPAKDTASHGRQVQQPLTGRQRQGRRILFAGPPPPIATSMLLYTDAGSDPRPSPATRIRDGSDKSRDSVDRRGSSVSRTESVPGDKGPRHLIPPPIASGALRSVLFGPAEPSSVTGGPGVVTGTSGSADPDRHDAALTASYRLLSRRERALQEELQVLLDAQVAGLVAGNGRGRGEGSREAGSQSTTTGLSRTGSRRSNYSAGVASPGAARHSDSLMLPMSQGTDSDGSGLSATFYTSRSNLTIRPTAAERSPELTGGSSYGRRESRSPALSSFQASRSSRNGTSVMSGGMGREATGRGAVVMPVRQPPPAKPPSLRGARAGIARAMNLLARVKEEEAAVLEGAARERRAAVKTVQRLERTKAVVEGRLRRALAVDAAVVAGKGGDRHTRTGTSAMSVGTTDNANDTLQQQPDADTPDGDEQDELQALGRELVALEEERRRIVAEERVVKERLAELNAQRVAVDTRREEVRNQRDAALSGYKGALRQARAEEAELLRRPPVRPVDMRLFAADDGRGVESLASQAAVVDGVQVAPSASPGGDEFLRLRPERRTLAMAREWWTAEVDMLERRKAVVETERTALEEGGRVWREAMEMVTEFEAGLRREMRGDREKGKESSESDGNSTQAKMERQLEKMDAVVARLEEKMALVGKKGWNLLICAVGAELEAFKEGAEMLRGALRASAATSNNEPDPPQAGSSSRHLADLYSLDAGNAAPDTASVGTAAGGATMQTERSSGRAASYEDHAEDDNEVPADLLVMHEGTPSIRAPAVFKREDSEDNEVPPDLLAESARDGDESD